MKGRFSELTWAAALGLGTFAAALAFPVGAAAQTVPPGSLPFGIYDPYGDYADVQGVDIEHLFLPWEDVLLSSLAEADTYVKERGRSLLVTIEPWTWTRDERNLPSVLRRGISSGEYDPTMRAVCAALSTMDTPMVIRWAQEMDDFSGQFIWAGWEPADYISAYKRMMGICREEVPKAQIMWSPLGYDNMADYYPGDEFVDMVGLSVFGLQAWEEAVLGEARSFEDIFGPRYERALQFDKPIMVAELGFVGDAAYVESWEEAVRSLGEKYPELKGVVYFGQKEVYPWPDGYGLPDWRSSYLMSN